MSDPLPRRQPQFQFDEPRGLDDAAAERRAARPVMEDPLEELARILGETTVVPARPETESGRRTDQPARAMPQQLSALEADLFDELRASVTPETRVRGDFRREITPPIPQHPADDRDIASLRIAPAEVQPEPPRSAEGAEAQWSDFYAYDDGVAAGSYDPAFDHVEAPRAAPAQAQPAYAEPRGAEAAQYRSPAYPHATFDEFGRDEIAAAALEAAPMVAAEPRIMPHSREEERAAARLPHEESGRGMKIAIAAVAVMMLGGGALAAWKYGGGGGSGEPVVIHADGKPLKTLPDPSKAPVADATPTLTPDDPKSASRIVSKQEEPVDQVSARTPEGKEVRLINPGAQRPVSDTPHTVKTVVVRPDGSIVSDGVSVRPAKTAAPAPVETASTAAPPAAPVAIPPAADAKAPATPPAADVKAPATPPAADAKAPAAKPAAPTADVKVPTAKPAAPAQPAATPPQIKTVAVTPITVPKPPVTPPTAAAPAPKPAAGKPAGDGAPLALGPVGPKLAPSADAPRPAAAAPPPVQAKPAAPAPVAITPPPGGGGGDFMVQISASGSEAEARNSFAAAQRKYGALSGKSVDVQRADLGSKGVFYRARVPAGSRDQASALCSQIQSQGGQCMVVKR